MNTPRRLTVAAAVGSAVLCVVAACSSGGGDKGQGALGNLAGPSGLPSAGGSAPTGKPTVTPTVHRSTSTPTTSPSSPSSPPSSPESSPPSDTATPANDYSITTTGNCYWSINYDAGANDLQVAVEFTIAFNGTSPAPTRPFNMATSNPTDGYHTTGDVALGTNAFRTGGLTYTASPLAGQMVTVTGSITSGDTFASDDSASIKVSMPTVAQIQTSGFEAGQLYPATCG